MTPPSLCLSVSRFPACNQSGERWQEGRCKEGFMPGILSFFSTNGLWQSQRSVDTWECQAWTRRVCNVLGWTKRQNKRDKANTNIRVCLWRRRGKQKSCPAWQQHSFWLVFIWAWPFDNRCDWGGLHSLHFLFVSKVIHLEYEGVGGGKGWRGEGVVCSSCYKQAVMNDRRAVCMNTGLMYSSVCVWLCLCVYVCAWDCKCLRAFYLYTTFACVYVVCVGVYVTHAWTPLDTGVQLHHTPVILSVILGFGRQWSVHKLKTLIHACHPIASPWWPPSIFIIIPLLSFVIGLPSPPSLQRRILISPSYLLLVSPEDSLDPKAVLSRL